MKGRTFEVIIPSNTSDHTSKTVYWIRHAQGHHNVGLEERGREALMDPKFFDAKLTTKGLSQVQQSHTKLKIHSKITGKPHFDEIELVVVSPLSRTLQSAIGMFPDKKIVAKEEVRERIGTHPCDKRRSIEELKTEFKNVDFSELLPIPNEEIKPVSRHNTKLKRSNDDIFWSEERETFEDIELRARDFMEWLKTRPEKTVAVVTHNDFLQIIFQTEKIRSQLSFDSLNGISNNSTNNSPNNSTNNGNHHKSDSHHHKSDSDNDTTVADEDRDEVELVVRGKGFMKPFANCEIRKTEIRFMSTQ
jgi:broad specificity phosphatase PhoE